MPSPGLDGHDREAKVIARALRDTGMEIIYAGLRQTLEMIVEAALQEDVAGVGLSILSGAYMTLVPRAIEGLREAGLEPVKVLVLDDITPLLHQGAIDTAKAVALNNEKPPSVHLGAGWSEESQARCGGTASRPSCRPSTRRVNRRATG